MTVKAILCLCVAVLLVTAAFPLLSSASGSEKVYGDVLRLHVRANSDSDRDQATKLAVRDDALKLISALTRGSSSAEETKQTVKKRIEMIKNVCDYTLMCRGSRDKAKVYISTEKFPDRTYGGVVFPAGIYTALRIDIGNAAGENWWCVLFPPVCTSGCTDAAEMIKAYGMDGCFFTVGRKYILRFKLWDTLCNIFQSGRSS